MTKAKWTLLGLLAALYATFWVWYGGNGDPLSEAEAEDLLAQMEEAYGTSLEDAPAGSILRNLTDMAPRDDGKEFYAVNLEQLKSGPEAEAADRRYAEMVFPLLFERGSHPVFVGDRAGLMLGSYGTDVDRVAVVRYRSLRDLFDMILDPAMRAGNDDKFLALVHTEVFIVRPSISFVQMRLLVGLIFLVFAFAGLKLLGRRGGSA